MHKLLVYQINKGLTIIELVMFSVTSLLNFDDRKAKQNYDQYRYNLLYLREQHKSRHQ